MRISARLIVGAAKLLTGASARWVDCEPSAHARVYFGTHTSNLDAIVILTALPRRIRDRCRMVAARDYWEARPLRSYVAHKAFRTLLVDRGKVVKSNNPVQRMFDAVESGESLIIFPEGGRQAGPDMIDFKSGLFHLARRKPDLEFVPTYLENMNRILPKGEILPVPLIGLATFGPPMSFQAGEGKREFLDRARRAIERLGEL